MATTGVGVSVPQSAAAFAPEDDPESLAKQKYTEGSALYSAADYSGAIKAFTEALTIVTREGMDPTVRGALLLNLGKSHVHAYDVDHDVGHLRAALSIYRRFVSEAESEGVYAESDVAESRQAINTLEEQIEEIEASSKPEGPAADSGSSADKPVDKKAEIKKAKNLGLGLTIGGAIGLLGGGGLVGYGATFRSRAVASVEDQGSDPNTGEGRDHVEREALKGGIVMGVGGVVALLGVAGLVVGPLQLAKAKRLQAEQDKGARLNVTPVFTADFAGASFSGRF